MLSDLDNLVLVVLVEWEGQFDSQAELSTRLKIPPASLTRSLNRLDGALLIRRKNNTAIKAHAGEYLVHGLRYVFPAKLGTRVRGVPTAFSTPPLSDEITAQENVVWPAEFGDTSGLELPPIHNKIPALCVAFPELHPAFAILDALRIGRARERELARRHLEKWIQNE